MVYIECAVRTDIHYDRNIFSENIASEKKALYFTDNFKAVFSAWSMVTSFCMSDRQEGYYFLHIVNIPLSY